MTELKSLQGSKEMQKKKKVEHRTKTSATGNLCNSHNSIKSLGNTTVALEDNGNNYGLSKVDLREIKGAGRATEKAQF